MILLQAAVYVGPMVLVWWGYGYLRKRANRRSSGLLSSERRAGLTEPPSLHPVIDPAECIGCQSCVTACPEGDVLGLIDGKAVLIRPTHCIGHGACKEACPTDAIELVFGTEKRGVDIPFVRENFETNVPGVFIAGELGGMGLIRNAIEQGRQAARAIVASLDSRPSGELLDTVIIGAGPAGISASLGAMESGLKFATFEQDSLGGTVAHYPRSKIVMTAPVDLPIVGKMRMRETTKEALLEFWEGVVRDAKLQINFNESVESIDRAEGGFAVKTTGGEYRARTVLLTIGRRGTPRKLGVPGEELPKVVYRLREPEQFEGQNVLVVGGGDSALEAALRIADIPGTVVTISYRSEAFSRARQKNRENMEAASRDGRISVVLRSTVSLIDAETATIERDDGTTVIPNDAVIVCAGGILPTAFLESVGIHVDTKFGTK